MSILAAFGLDAISRISSALGDAYKARLAAENDEQRRVAEAAIKQLEVSLAAYQESEKSRREAMNHPVFWWVWSLFAVPLGIWWALVMTDTFLTSVAWGIPDLPEAVKPWASTIFGSIFGSGGAVAGIQTIASAIRGRK